MCHTRFKSQLFAMTLPILGAATSFLAPVTPVLAAAQPNPITQNFRPRGFADIVSRVKPAVVSVQVKGETHGSEGLRAFFDFPDFDDLPDDHPLKQFFQNFGSRYQRHRHTMRGHLRPIAQGSGFFVSEDGYLVTNNHVVKEGEAYTVVLDDGTQLEAKLVGTDPRTDLAVLKVDSKRKFTFVKFADDKDIHVGDWVLAVGNPFGLGGTVTAGIISARGRDIGTSAYDDFIQIDAAVNRGNSGGPTFDLDGRVVGVNTAIFSPSGGNVGIAFAIPSTIAGHVVEELIKKGSVDRGWVGIQIQPMTKEIADSIGLSSVEGAIVADPMDGPAEKAGIKSGDAIVSVNGKKVTDVRDLARKIADLPPHKTAVFGIWRDNKLQNINVDVIPMPADKNKPKVLRAAPGSAEEEALDFLGLSVSPNPTGPGLVVTDVDPDGVAAEKGVRLRDVITKINGVPAKVAADLSDALKAAKKAGRKAILLQVESHHQNHFIALPVSE